MRTAEELIKKIDNLMDSDDFLLEGYQLTPIMYDPIKLQSKPTIGVLENNRLRYRITVEDLGVPNGKVT
jgi:hypothetical protein